MRATYTCWVPASPDEVMERLELGPNLIGTTDADEGTFNLQYRVPNFRNSWRPRMHGEVSPAGTGTLIEVELSVHPFIMVFTAFHAVFFLGLSWLLGAAAFSWEVPKATAALKDAVEATVEGPDALAQTGRAADPTQPGAEAHAPASFRVRSNMDRVRFSVRAKDGWLLPGTKRFLKVSGGGVELDGETIPWDAIRGSALSEAIAEPTLALAIANREVGLSIPMGAHAESDVRWLAQYLSSRAERWRADPEDARRLQREAQVLTGKARPKAQEQ